MPSTIEAALTQSRISIPNWLRPNLTPSECGVIMAVWVALQMVAQAPLHNPHSAAYILLFVFVILLSRNVAIACVLALVLNVALRFAYPISSWPDQHWIEWYSISSLATGHSLLVGSPLVGMSMASYLPEGDLFGGLFIALGIQKYGSVWAVAVPLLFALPVAMAPSATTLAVFIATAFYWPFADLTNAGGNLEIQVALLFVAIASYRHGRKTAAVIFFAFASLLRQPYITVFPFVFVLLWHQRDYGRMKLFAALLVLFGGIYILLDPKGAYWYEYRIWDSFQESYYNQNLGLLNNYTISSIPHAFGIDDKVAWVNWKGIYTPLTAAGVLTLFVIAWRSRLRDTVLFLTVLAPVFVYIFARGYAQYHYLVAASFPFLAFLAPSDGPKRFFERHFSRGMAMFILWVGLSPFVIFAVGKTADVIGSIRNVSALPIAHTNLVGFDGLKTEFPNMDGTDPHHQVCAMNQGLEFDFAEPLIPTAMRLAGDHVHVETVQGVNTLWASIMQMRGIITRGTIEYSADGNKFDPPREFTNTLTYEAFPVTINLPKTERPVRAIRIHAKDLYMKYDQWMLGNIEFFGHH